MTLDLGSLNPQQRRAVEHPQGPLLVFAGAGSGKTRVITYRIAKLISSGLSPGSILAVTFTNKAAREMRVRIEHLVGPRSRAIWMGTFHSVCGRMLRESGRMIGLSPNFVIFDDADQLSLIKTILKERGVDDRSVNPRAIRNEISRAKERLISAERYESLGGGFIERIVADVYPIYADRLQRNNALDFDDMLSFAVRLLKERPEALEKYQARFRHVLVDEFQDVNQAQYELVRHLVQEHRNITIVGDDDQSIYAWRGADVEFILKFASEFEKATVIKLEENYRSTKNILRVANAVIEKNRGRAPKRLWTDNPEGTPVTVTELGTEQDEAAAIAERIMSDVRGGTRNYGDFAILYRTNAQSRAIEDSFVRWRIPYILIGAQRFYERKEIKDMIAYLRLAANPSDDIAFKRIINSPARGIGATTVKRIEEMAGSRPMFLQVQDEEFCRELRPQTRASIRTFVRAILDARSLVGTSSTEQILRSLLVGTGYMDALRAEKTEEASGRLENLQELVNVAVQHDTLSDEPGLNSFLQEVALLSDADEITEEKGVVTLMTAHTAKGLEFPVVFLGGMEEGLFPHSRSMTSDKQIEEERRLCYVAMTRAREELHVTFAARRATYGQPVFNSPSRFLSAIPEAEVSSLREAPELSAGVRPRGPASYEPQVRVLKKPDWRAPFEVGQQVRHEKFGTGVVVSCFPVRDDCEVTVAFPGVIGVKRLLQSVARLDGS